MKPIITKNVLFAATLFFSLGASAELSQGKYEGGIYGEIPCQEQLFAASDVFLTETLAQTNLQVKAMQVVEIVSIPATSVNFLSPSDNYRLWAGKLNGYRNPKGHEYFVEVQITELSGKKSTINLDAVTQDTNACDVTVRLK